MFESTEELSEKAHHIHFGNTFDSLGLGQDFNTKNFMNSSDSVPKLVSNSSFSIIREFTRSLPRMKNGCDCNGIVIVIIIITNGNHPIRSLAACSSVIRLLSSFFMYSLAIKSCRLKIDVKIAEVEIGQIPKEIRNHSKAFAHDNSPSFIGYTEKSHEDPTIVYNKEFVVGRL
ncbi:hypothetical protein Tco_1541818 [Tanacetum coccineum]